MSIKNINLGICLSLILFINLASSAQPSRFPQGRESMNRIQQKTFSPEQKMDRLAEKLNLSAAQKEQMAQIMEKHKERMHQINEEEKNRLRSEIKSILTDEQENRFVELEQKRSKQWHKRPLQPGQN
jgi:Spy/CpxP family protein refolding chaperone